MGGDVHLMQDNLELSFDLFDTVFNNNPRFQARALLAVYKKSLFLIAGADDLFNYEPATGGRAGRLTGSWAPNCGLPTLTSNLCCLWVAVPLLVAVEPSPQVGPG